MRIESITIKNFRCIGEPITISLQKDITTFIGTNGTGKTAVMLALQRLFGITNEQRYIKPNDFHIPHNENTPLNERNLFIEAIICFPELDSDSSSEGQNTVPLLWQQISVADDGQLKCRLRLEATWCDDGSIDGAIEENLYGVRSLTDNPDDNNRVPLKSSQRSAIQVIYIPANRDGVTQITQLLRSKLWKAIKWQEELKSRVQQNTQAINKAFSDSTIISIITQHIQTEWCALHTGGTHTNPLLRPIEAKFEDLIKRMNVTFAPNEQGGESEIYDLSDGQRSLFHLAMTMATLRLELELRQPQYNEIYDIEAANFTALTIIALEEPENCLAPFYLSKILQQLKEITQNNVQTIISSHSSSILTRIEPEVIRYFKLNEEKRTEVNLITLPSADDEAHKYVKEAVKAYPEIYFARLVIFGEGDSEEVILPRLAESKGVFLDRSFVAIVPLGGRHVNHFWRLVNDLNIPHITLLDLDKGREGGGWGRIKYVISQLVQLGGYQPNTFISEENNIPAQDSLNSMHNWTDYSTIGDFVSRLEEYNIFFSNPLDIDWSMLKAFFTQYTILDDGQRGPQSTIEKAKEAVLKTEGNPALYEESDNRYFPWYNYLFLGRSKPTTHLTVLNRISTEELCNYMPSEFIRLLEKASQMINDSDTVEANND